MHCIAILVIIAVLVVCAGSVGADGWQWPQQINIAGFNITGINGTVGGDGSGRATGDLRVPGADAQRVTLVRTQSGDVSGTATNIRIGGAEIRGNLVLNSSGLRGRGTIGVQPRPVTDAEIVVNPDGRIAGGGRIELGGLSMQVRISGSGRALELAGAVPVQREADTPLAVYKFDGKLNVSGGSPSVTVTAVGQVVRTGKLANQQSTSSVSDVRVNPSDGSSAVNVNGVSVTFKFF